MPIREKGKLVSMVAPLVTLADVILWGLSLSPERSVKDVFIQDEYTHDVIVDWHQERYLVFDST